MHHEHQKPGLGASAFQEPADNKTDDVADQSQDGEGGQRHTVDVRSKQIIARRDLVKRRLAPADCEAGRQHGGAAQLVVLGEDGVQLVLVPQHVGGEEGHGATLDIQHTQPLHQLPPVLQQPVRSGTWQVEGLQPRESRHGGEVKRFQLHPWQVQVRERRDRSFRGLTVSEQTSDGIPRQKEDQQSGQSLQITDADSTEMVVTQVQAAEVGQGDVV